MRGLQSTPRQLALPLAGRDQVDGMWGSLSPQARERVLRLLASAIARIISDEQQQQEENER